MAYHFAELRVCNKNFEEGTGMQYSIQGDNLPVVICTLGQGDQMLTEKGAMSWMTPHIAM